MIFSDIIKMIQAREYGSLHFRDGNGDGAEKKLMDREKNVQEVESIRNGKSLDLEMSENYDKE